MIPFRIVVSDSGKTGSPPPPSVDDDYLRHGNLLEIRPFLTLVTTRRVVVTFPGDKYRMSYKGSLEAGTVGRTLVTIPFFLGTKISRTPGNCSLPEWARFICEINFHREIRGRILLFEPCSAYKVD